MDTASTPRREVRLLWLAGWLAPFDAAAAAADDDDDDGVFACILTCIMHWPLHHGLSQRPATFPTCLPTYLPTYLPTHPASPSSPLSEGGWERGEEIPAHLACLPSLSSALGASFPLPSLPPSLLRPGRWARALVTCPSSVCLHAQQYQQQASKQATAAACCYCVGPKGCDASPGARPSRLGCQCVRSRNGQEGDESMRGRGGSAQRWGRATRFMLCGCGGCARVCVRASIGTYTMWVCM